MNEQVKNILNELITFYTKIDLHKITTIADVQAHLKGIITDIQEDMKGEE